MTYRDLRNKSIKERHEFLLKAMSSQRFLNREGLGNEVPFFICAYNPEEMVEMEKEPEMLQSALLQSGVKVLIIDLYDACITLLEKRGILKQVIDEEPAMDKDELKELLQGVLDAERHVVPMIAGLMAENEFNIMIIKGVGRVFPYLRSHNVLNNLQKAAKDRPTLMFFPGKYTHSLEDGASLDLFGLLHDDKYYRAFDIYNYEI